MLMKLELTEAVKNEVSNTYKQFIKSEGKTLVLSTVPFRRENGLRFNTNNAVTSVLVPLDKDLIDSLTHVENFIKSLVPLEKYKPLWLKNSMFVNVSKWCKYELVKPDGTTQSLPEDMSFGAGIYKIDITVSHLYIGPHRGGEHYSLSLHATKIAYEPAQSFVDIFADVTNDQEPPHAAPKTLAYEPVSFSPNVVPKVVHS